MKVGVVIAAGGSGLRMGAAMNKVLLPVAGKPMLQHSLECFAAVEEVSEMVVVTRPEDQRIVQALLEKLQLAKEVRIVPGGAERQNSVYQGLKALRADTEWVMIHDGARPYLTVELVRRGLEAALRHGAVGLAVPVKDTVKRAQNQVVMETLPRQELWAMQTPQIFRYDLILQAHEWAREQGVLATDDCALVEALGHPVHLVMGDYRNIKITTPEDLPRFADMRIGFGYDVHRLVAGRPLILGGVEIPYEQGLLGHSDADVLTHAVMDALLGAMGEGDIGEHFPDTDPSYAGISSMVLLAKVMELVNGRGFAVNNLDVVVMAQRPKLSPWKGAMGENLAQALEIPRTMVNVKATTTEGLGFVGRGEGIAAQAVVSLRPTWS